MARENQGRGRAVLGLVWHQCDAGIELAAGATFDFRTLGLLGGVDYSAGAERFRILGIETSALLDPSDVTAFVTTVTFSGSGTFTGSMTPITEFVADAQVPAPTSLGLLLAGLALTIPGLRNAFRA